MTASITPQQLQALIASGTAVDLIDVRTPAEYAGCHVPQARNLPLDGLDAVQLKRGGGPLYVICQGGTRSRKACTQLEAAGLTEVVDVLGGTNAWQAAGLPVTGSGKSVFGVERQVRCIIGGGVVAGAVLALTVHPAWVYLSGFFGAGLFIAGLTNFCGLALVVAAMPWNRSKAAGSSCCAPAKSTAGDACCGGK